MARCIPRKSCIPRPNERHWWKIAGGEQAAAILTDCGPIGVMICYDSEFPELARHLVDQGALMLFVPFCTDVRQGYLRVRYCSQARAVENQCYVITSGNVGNLPGVNNFDIQYAQSGIFTPCDFPFPPDGIAAMTHRKHRSRWPSPTCAWTRCWSRAPTARCSTSRTAATTSTRPPGAVGADSTRQ